MTMQSGNPPVIVLPPGVSVTGYRETSQTGPFGSIVQGIAFAVSFSGGTTTVFVPNTDLENPAAIEATIRGKVAAIQGVLGAGS